MQSIPNAEYTAIGAARAADEIADSFFAHIEKMSRLDSLEGKHPVCALYETFVLAVQGLTMMGWTPTELADNAREISEDFQ